MLYLHENPREASPKAISGRTSYRRVRLAFHPYPQLILQLFTADRFGPPRGLTPASPWPWIDHPVSGLQQTTQRPVRTRFRYGSGPKALNLAAHHNSPAHSPKGTPSSRRTPTACKHTVSGSISLRSRGSFHLSLTVLVRYRSLRVFSLGRWSSHLPTGFLVSRGTRDNTASPVPTTTGLSPPMAGLSRPIRLSVQIIRDPLQRTNVLSKTP